MSLPFPLDMFAMKVPGFPRVAAQDVDYSIGDALELVRVSRVKSNLCLCYYCQGVLIQRKKSSDED